MKGFIKIEAIKHNDKEGLYVETDLKHVSRTDRIEVLHALCIAFNVSVEDLKFLSLMVETGIADKMADVEVLEDPSGAAKRALEPGYWEKLFKAMFD